MSGSLETVYTHLLLTVRVEFLLIPDVRLGSESFDGRLVMMCEKRIGCLKTDEVRGGERERERWLVTARIFLSSVQSSRSSEPFRVIRPGHPPQTCA